jgi:hypothetical protein
VTAWIVLFHPGAGNSTKQHSCPQPCWHHNSHQQRLPSREPSAFLHGRGAVQHDVHNTHQSRLINPSGRGITAPTHVPIEAFGSNMATADINAGVLQQQLWNSFCTAHCCEKQGQPGCVSSNAHKMYQYSRSVSNTSGIPHRVVSMFMNLSNAALHAAYTCQQPCCRT